MTKKEVHAQVESVIAQTLVQIALKHIFDFAREDQDIRQEILRKACLKETEENYDLLNRVLDVFVDKIRGRK